MTDFIAVDGESWTEGNDHNYVLLANSKAQWIYEPKGLSTVRCFEFLLNLPKKTVKVAFGWNYDVNMILRDVPVKHLIELQRTGLTRWNTYYIEWIPSKCFVLKSSGRSVKVFDVFGFFQSSFVKALAKWGIPVPQDMEEMKKARSTFDAALKKKVIEYCIDECGSLVTLMQKLEKALSDTDLKLNNWIGAGAIASTLMKRHKVNVHHNYDAEWPSVEPAIMSSYYGGRVELFRPGQFQNLWDYDISSAYPSIAQYLPSLAKGSWEQVAEYRQDLEYVLWDCEWELPEATLCPFPLRRKGAIYYPRNGRGWYHHTEVRAAQQLTDGAINVHGGWKFNPASQDQPFDFIPLTYVERAKLKRKKHAGEKVLKLGLNSIYGKLAQGVGFQGSKPLFQSFFWAGMITAGTRAKVLEVAMTNPDDLVMIATDGIFFKADPKVELRDGLGGLELSLFTDAFVAQPGVYQATDEDGTSFGKSRGFFNREIDWDDLREGFQREGLSYVGSYNSERFCGLGSSLMNRRMDMWRHWNKSERALSLTPARKFVEDYSDVFPHCQLIPPMFPEVIQSEPYVPKPGFDTITESEIQGMLEYLQGNEQPLRDY